MQENDGPYGVRPVPVPPAARDLIRQVAHERPADRPPAADRRFHADGQDWIARIVGESAGGTGTGPAAYLVAIHFFNAAAPDVPVRETLLPRGRFDSLYDEELRELFRTARPLPPKS